MNSNQNIQGRGSQHHLFNSFSKQEYTTEWDEGVDEYTHLDKPTTKIFYEHPKKIIHKVSSPGVGMEYSINPYRDVSMDVFTAMPAIHMNIGAGMQA